MTTTEIVTLSVYGLGAIAYVVTFFIQKAQIDKMKSTTEQIERFVTIFDLKKVEEYVKIREKTLKFKQDNLIHSQSKKLTDKMMKEVVTPMLNNHFNEWQQHSGELTDELGYFVVGFLCECSDESVEKILENHFPKSADLIRHHVKAQKDWERDHPDAPYFEDASK